MKKTIKYYLALSLIPLLLITITTTLTSCDPHRAGSVIKGPGAKNNRHNRPASAKRHRKNKY
jgi:hypothetical protein